LKDLPALAARTKPEKLIERFNIVGKLHGNRQALLGYADEFVRQLESLKALFSSRAT
jgi:hypothetical protein